MLNLLDFKKIGCSFVEHSNRKKMRKYSKLSSTLKKGVLSIYKTDVEQFNDVSFSTFTSTRTLFRIDLFAVYVAMVSAFVLCVTVLSF